MTKLCSCCQIQVWATPDFKYNSLADFMDTSRGIAPSWLSQGGRPGARSVTQPSPSP